MPSPILALVLAVMLPGLAYAADGEALFPNARIGAQWRKATLPDPTASTPSATSDDVDQILELARSPIWQRLRELVLKSSKPELAEEMTEENLVKLIGSGGSFSTMKKDATEDPKKENAPAKKEEATDPNAIVK